MNFANINGVSIHYSYLNKGSDKPLIVFSNSLATDFRIWQSCVDDLVKDYSILLYDKRGHGLSGLGNSPYIIDDHINDLTALIPHFKDYRIKMVTSDNPEEVHAILDDVANKFAEVSF